MRHTMISGDIGDPLIYFQRLQRRSFYTTSSRGQKSTSSAIFVLDSQRVNLAIDNIAFKPKVQTRPKSSLDINDATMVRPKKDIEPYADDIRAWIHDGLNATEQRGLLLRLHNFEIGASTLARWSQAQGIKQRRSNCEITPVLKQLMAEAFADRKTDDETLKMLNEKGYDILMPTVKRIRTVIGLRKKVPKGLRESTDKEIKEALVREMADGHIRDCGRNEVYDHMRRKYNFVGRDRMYKIVRDTFPDRVLSRKADIRVWNGRHKPKDWVPTQPGEVQAQSPSAQPQTYSPALSQSVQQQQSYPSLPPPQSSTSSYPPLPPMHPQPTQSYPPLPSPSQLSAPPQQQQTVAEFRQAALGALGEAGAADARLLQAWQQHVDSFIDPSLRG
ncbi:hypothetical protein LTR56_016582 [Elasticomyces elasticus]|nr:hypothetical protein LTR56_016582 [Elasticomyces elasticus]KAK3650613.1 hypothetical protein LTR22_012471 [Elasticomyces elasticus]KAK4913946.1 hypothetical protein LTR49_017764 [Elasticomyces elasticus]KAK5753110.1 hypothetical protein LTS12_016789 [Elasticomyces elasticus]